MNAVEMVARCMRHQDGLREYQHESQRSEEVASTPFLGGPSDRGLEGHLPLDWDAAV